VKGAANDRITIADKEGEKTYSVSRDARILCDDKEGKLTDLIDGTLARLRQSADKGTVLEIRAEGPSFHGVVKLVDADNKTITLTIGAKNGAGGEDKSFPLTKDTRIVTAIYGVPLKLADVKPDNEVILRLTIDQKATARITLPGQ
jgi:hypothetical protein